MAELTFPAPISQPISQFVSQCTHLCPPNASLSTQFIALVKCNNEQVSGHAKGLLTNVSQFPENKVGSCKFIYEMMFSYFFISKQLGKMAYLNIW